MSKYTGAKGRFFFIWGLLLLLPQAYLFNVLIGLDFLMNALIGGDPSETISSRLGKGKLARKPVHSLLSRFVDALFLLLFRQRNHCVLSIQRNDGHLAISEVIDRHRAGLPPVWVL